MDSTAKVDSQRLSDPIWVGNTKTKRQLLMGTNSQTGEITLSKSDGELLATYPAGTTNAQIVKDMGTKGSKLFGKGEVLNPKNEGFVLIGWVGNPGTNRQLVYGTNSNGFVIVRDEKGETLETYKKGTTKEEIRVAMNDPESPLYNKGPKLVTTLSNPKRQSSIPTVQPSLPPTVIQDGGINPSLPISGGAGGLGGPVTLPKDVRSEPPKPQSSFSPSDIKISGALTIQYITNQTGAREIRFVGTGSAKIPFDGGSLDVTAGARIRQTISRTGKTDWILEPQVGANLTIKTGAGVVALNSLVRLNMSTGQVWLDAGGSLKMENGVTISGRALYNIQTGILTELETGVKLAINKDLDGVIRIYQAKNATSSTTELEAGVTVNLGSVAIKGAAVVNLVTGKLGVNGTLTIPVSEKIDINLDGGEFLGSRGDSRFSAGIKFKL